jgi:hypothetical protein
MSSRPKHIENPEQRWTADGTSATMSPSSSKYRNLHRVPSGRWYAIGEHLERTPFINMKAVLREKSLATAAQPQGTIASRIRPVGVAQEDLAQVPTSQDDTATATSTTSPSRTTTNRLTCTILPTSAAQELSHRDAEGSGEGNGVGSGASGGEEVVVGAGVGNGVGRGEGAGEGAVEGALSSRFRDNARPDRAN